MNLEPPASAPVWPVPAAAAEARVPLTHTIKGGELALIAFRNALLSVITLGIWSFWAKTRIRRYIWSNIQVDGDALHYTGTGFELFKGAVVATLVLMGLFVPLGFVSAAGHPSIAGFTQGFLFVILTPIGLFFARRYRFSRTEWRGIRAGFAGDLKPFFLRVSAWTLLGTLTLGFTEPFRQVYMERYFWNHSYIGQLKFSSDLTVKKLGYLYWVGWAIFFMSIFVFIGILYWKSGGNFKIYQDPRKLNHDQSIFFAVGFLTALGFIIVGLILSLLFRARLLRASLSSLTLGPVQVASSFSLWQAFKIGFAVVFMFTVPSGLLLAFAIGFIKTVSDGWGVFLAILAPFLLVGGTAALWAKYWTARFTATLVETLNLAGQLDAETIAQSDLLAPGQGEGLLGAVDLGL